MMSDPTPPPEPSVEDLLRDAGNLAKLIRWPMDQNGSIVAREFASRVANTLEDLASRLRAFGSELLDTKQRFSQLYHEYNDAAIQYREELTVLRAQLADVRSDNRDMRENPCAIWVRCKGCGRLHNQGWQCPTDDCEEGT